MTLEEIEERWKDPKAIFSWQVNIDIDWLISRLKEMEAQQQGIGQMINRAHARIEQLEDGIRKHKNTEIGSNYKIEQMEIRDKALYKLLKE